MTCSNEDRGRSRRPGADDWGWSHKSDTRWSGDREICQWFGVKTTGTVFSSLASKPVATSSWLSPKTKVVEGFPVWVLKSAATVY
jgi:hypothetical protein